VGSALNNLGALYHLHGRYAEAESVYKRDLDITGNALGPNHPSVGTTLFNLATFYQARARYADAEPLYMRAISILETALGSDHPEVGQLSTILRHCIARGVATPTLSRSWNALSRSAKPHWVLTTRLLEKA
jgi:tetratricopeptide (TPR) repeat protein